MNKRYSLWWGDSCLCGNFEDLTLITQEIAQRIYQVGTSIFRRAAIR